VVCVVAIDVRVVFAEALEGKMSADIGNSQQGATPGS
jgi:hypothetical protein